MSLKLDIEILSVSHLNRLAKNLIEDNLFNIWVEGEISNLARPASGHIYFTLKDSQAQVRCAFFRGRNSRLNFDLENGMQVFVNANASLYEGRGDYQLIIEKLELSGEGALRQQFEMLKAKLANEGLFSEKYKKSLPTAPRIIGIITSATGAAIKDTLTVLRRRYPLAEVIIFPCQVQGETAAKQILQALKKAESLAICDVLLMVRGGGSLEDLHCFNDETLARAIFACKTPVVTGIGHEIDFTIADFVADCRAATPSAAAELISPDASAWVNDFANLHKRLCYNIKQLLKHCQLNFQSASKRLRHPDQILREYNQRLDYLEQSLQACINQLLLNHQAELQKCSYQLQQHNPVLRLNLIKEQIQNIEKQLCNQVKNILMVKQQVVNQLGKTLNVISPLAVLERGFSITQDSSTKTVLRSVKDIKVGDTVCTRLHDGEFQSTVDSIKN